MTFQVSDSKGRNFLDLLGDDLNPIEPSSSKGGPWLLQSGHSNLLCSQTSRAITNHAPIGEYRLKLFLKRVSPILVVYTLLKQDNTFFTNVVGLTTIGIQEGILYPIFLFFSNLIQVLLCSLSHLYSMLLIISHYHFKPYIPFIYVSFFSFSISLLSFCFSLHIVSVWMYIVMK